jgi:hypothetical protein
MKENGAPDKISNYLAPLQLTELHPLPLARE